MFVHVSLDSKPLVSALLAPWRTVPARSSLSFEQDAVFQCHIVVESHLAMFL